MRTLFYLFIYFFSFFNASLIKKVFLFKAPENLIHRFKINYLNHFLNKKWLNNEEKFLINLNEESEKNLYSDTIFLFKNSIIGFGLSENNKVLCQLNMENLENVLHINSLKTVNENVGKKFMEVIHESFPNKYFCRRVFLPGNPYFVKENTNSQINFWMDLNYELYEAELTLSERSSFNSNLWFISNSKKQIELNDNLSYAKNIISLEVINFK